MLRLIDYGYADTGKELIKKINAKEWETSRASRVEYNVGGGYGASESSNGKIVGTFEAEQSKINILINYNHTQVMNMQDIITKSNWLMGEVESDAAILTMMASEDVLGRDWNTPEEDEAWENL